MNGYRNLKVESPLVIYFKGAQYPKDVILFAVFFYVRYGVSYRDLEEIMHEQGVSVDHTTLNRWVTRFAGVIAETARHRKGPCDRSWRIDDTYFKVKGTWVTLTERSTSTAKLAISCFQYVETNRLRQNASLRCRRSMVYREKSSLTKAAPTQLVSRP